LSTENNSSDISKDNSDSVIVKKSTLNKILVGVIAAITISAFLGGYITGVKTVESEKIFIQEAKNNPNTISPAQSPIQPQRDSIVSVSLDDDPVKGNPNAPITIIEFSDFQCPFCKRFHETTLPMLEKNYISTGKVKFVYRDFPITNIHPNAVPTALASECADDQGKFWEYHDKIFVNQKSWQDLEIADSVNVLKQYAIELGLDMGEFNQCLETGKYLDEIQNDLQDGRDYGVTGTPGFFIGNEKLGYVRVIGAQPYSVFEQVLDEQLNKSK
jgi:protein-disulfide isomerase